MPDHCKHCARCVTGCQLCACCGKCQNCGQQAAPTVNPPLAVPFAPYEPSRTVPERWVPPLEITCRGESTRGIAEPSGIVAHNVPAFNSFEFRGWPIDNACAGTINLGQVQIGTWPTDNASH